MQDRHHRTAGAERRESGVALIWAIIVMLVVLGAITLIASLTLTTTDETRDAANRTRSSLWAQAASDDIVQRLRRREIGYDITRVLPTGDELFAVPQVGLTVPTAPSVSFPVPGASSPNAARAVTFNRSGTTYRGWYQVLPPENVLPAAGWQARLVRDGSRPGDQGSFELIVRTWEDGRRAEPVVARLTYRHASFSRFSLLSDDTLRIGLGAGVGGGSPAGYIHSNNSRNVANAITIEPGTNTTSTKKFTTTRGTISGCPAASKCAANIREVVEFGAAARAMDAVGELAALTTPVSYSSTGIARTFGPPAAPPATGARMPVWWVRLDGASCGADQLAVWSNATYPLRGDLVGVPLIDDAKPPAFPVGSPTCVAVAEGGGSFRFNGDVVVGGRRTSSRAVTIFARREAGFPAVRVDVDGDGAPTNLVKVSAPASIYLLADSNAGRIGSTSALAPIGLVAEGGIYLPSRAMMAGQVNNNLQVDNVAAMAAGAEIAYGPSIISVAADANQPGLGLSPTQARAMGYGWGAQLRWNGALASRRPVMFRYGTATFLGYMQRRVSFVPEMLWNGPPGYPSDRDWHMTDYEEFRSL